MPVILGLDCLDGDPPLPPNLVVTHVIRNVGTSLKPKVAASREKWHFVPRTPCLLTGVAAPTYLVARDDFHDDRKVKFSITFHFFLLHSFGELDHTSPKLA